MIQKGGCKMGEDRRGWATNRGDDAADKTSNQKSWTPSLWDVVPVFLQPVEEKIREFDIIDSMALAAQAVFKYFGGCLVCWHHGCDMSTLRWNKLSMNPINIIAQSQVDIYLRWKIMTQKKYWALMPMKKHSIAF